MIVTQSHFCTSFPFSNIQTQALFFQENQSTNKPVHHVNRSEHHEVKQQEDETVASNAICIFSPISIVQEKPTKTLFEKPSESQCPPEAKAIFEDLAIDDGEIEDFFEDNSIDVDEIKSSSNEEIVKESSKEEDGVEEPAKECEEEENTSKDGDEPKAPTNDEHADDLKELIARWKNAIEKENGEELENVYDDIVRLADTFSFDFIK
jgi:hypothetical protein